VDDLLTRARAGEVRALARLLTWVENRARGIESVMKEAYLAAGNARIVGITGSPGAGKSTLVDGLVTAYAASGAKTAVIAVDPSSPFTGGAILGDRIRMSGHDRGADVFVRSMATRGHLGGLGAATADIVTVMDAAGRDPVLIETVGVGQDEVEIARIADISVVILMPGMGDDVQALKAGIMEIGDIFVINKCDRPGADELERTIRGMLALAPEHSGAVDAPIIRTIATRNEGIGELRDAIARMHADTGRETDRVARKRDAVTARLRALLEERLVGTALERVSSNGKFESIVDSVVRREQDPYTAIEAIIDNAGFGGRS